MASSELLVLLILGFLLLFFTLILSIHICILFKVVACQLCDDDKARLFCGCFLSQADTCLLKVSGQVAQDVSESYQDGRALPVLDHGLEVILDMPTLDDFFSAFVVERDLRQDSGYI